jgi:hypothetical protein
VAHVASACRTRLYQCAKTWLEGYQKRGVTAVSSAGEFDLFITSDHNIRYQQNLLASAIAVFELSTNDLWRIRAAAVMIQSEVSAMKPGAYRRIIIP